MDRISSAATVPISGGEFRAGLLLPLEEEIFRRGVESFLAIFGIRLMHPGHCHFKKKSESLEISGIDKQRKWYDLLHLMQLINCP
ncbi:unnamed protein product [Arctia plantaginis]|uniref:Uncharacterized protein n=1 Tax=Arctia plantaginis TaxID=874455 RepID=A0A8S1A7K8_ARCPL|nr:unnamed protein product [Arctia plantaginis]